MHFASTQHSRDLIGQAARPAWLIFTLAATTLAVAGIPGYFSVSLQPCDGRACFASQLTSAEASLWRVAGETTLSYALWQVVSTITTGLLLLGAAYSLAWRASGNPAAVLAGFVTTALATTTFAQALAFHDARFALPAGALLTVAVAGLMPAVCLFPDGHFQPRAMRWFTGVYVIACVAFLWAGEGFSGGTGTVRPVLTVAFVLAAVALVLGNSWLRLRRIEEPTRREQMQWLLASLGLAVPVVLLGGPLRLVHLTVLPDGWVVEPFIGLVIGLLLAVGSITCLFVALSHYEPAATDVLVSRGLVYVLLTAFVVTAYVLIVGYLSLVFESDNILLSLIATGLVAVAFQPLRERLQRLVSRMVYGERDEPYQVIARLGQQLGGVPEGTSALALTAETIGRALRLRSVSIVTGQGDAIRELASYRAVDGSVADLTAGNGLAARDEVARYPLTYAGHHIGELRVASRAEREGLTAADEHFLAVLAGQLGMAVHAASVTSELEQARLRIVTEREEARRRLGSDLHDIVGHRLVALSRNVEVTAGSEELSAAARLELAAVNLHLSEVTRQVRSLAHSMYPPELDVLGLAGALREQIHNHAGLHITVEATEELPQLPAVIASAAYSIALEALTNIEKHASARTSVVRLRCIEGVLELEVADDGSGFDTGAARGLGLLSMKARAAEVGGSCRITSRRGGGTTVVARLPIPLILE